MQLFYAPDITLPFHTLGEEESRHCSRVLRLAAGDSVHLTDGRGNLYSARVSDPSPKGCVVEITDTVSEYGKRPYGLTLAVAPTRNADRFEWLLEKATEIGVDRFIPLECAHSERRAIKPQREERVITSAVKQSLKAYRPVLEGMTRFDEMASSDFRGVKLIAHCDKGLGERRFIGECVSKSDDVLILIGPEGDFSQEEINFALSCGFRAVTLGDMRLRTETAALAAVTEVGIINR